MLARWPSGPILVAACMQAASVDGIQRSAGTFDAERRRMVDEQLKARDIRDPRVLDAMVKVPRHLFVPESLRARAHSDSPLPIGDDQTISQPYIVAFYDAGVHLVGIGWPDFEVQLQRNFSILRMADWQTRLSVDPLRLGKRAASVFPVRIVVCHRLVIGHESDFCDFDFNNLLL